MLEKEVKKIVLDLSLITHLGSHTPLFLFNSKALLDEQRHHVCEGPRSLGYALQVCRADEHPNAFQVKERQKRLNF